MGDRSIGCLSHPPTGDLDHSQACALTGNRTGDPLGHRPALSPLSHTSQCYMLLLKQSPVSRGPTS